MQPQIQINKAFLWLFTDQSRFKVLRGGAGSSKSHSVMIRVLTRFLSEKGANGIICRKVQATLKKSVFASAKKILRGDPNNEEATSRGMGIDDTVVSVNNSDLFFKNKKNGNIIFFLGMDDPEKIKSITAENGDIQWVFVEEASEFDEADIDQLNTRLRGKSSHLKEIILCFNPVSEDHWLKKVFFDKPKYKSLTTHHSTAVDNAFVDEEYIQTLDDYKDTDPYHYTVYRLGHWGSLDEHDVIIPYPIIYKAKQNVVEAEGGFDIGVDAARFGDDEAVIYIRRGLKILDKTVLPKCDGFQLAMATKMLMEKYKPQKGMYKVRVKVDITGVGASCFDFLNRTVKIENATLYEINFGGNAKDNDQYANCATEMYYEAKGMIPEMELLKDDEKCFSQLSRRRYNYDNKVRKKIEPKPDYKKRIGISPDDADAFVLCLYDPPHISSFATGSGDKDYSELDEYQDNSVLLSEY